MFLLGVYIPKANTHICVEGWCRRLRRAVDAGTVQMQGTVQTEVLMLCNHCLSLSHLILTNKSSTSAAEKWLWNLVAKTYPPLCLHLKIVLNLLKNTQVIQGVKNPPANAREMGFIPGLGSVHMTQGK